MTNEITEKENKRIKNTYLALLRVLRENTTKENQLKIRKAFNMALEMYAEKRRKTGEPLIHHPLNVARIAAAEIGLGTTSVIAGLLHEVEDIDCCYTIHDIEKEFGDRVVNVIRGLNKISKVGNKSTSMQAENFRNLILTMASDVLVILIKLADQLDEMRMANDLSPENQVKLASETSYLYAPLAHRLGLYNLKSELEDLSMKYLEREAYKDIVKQLADSKQTRDRFIRTFIKPIKEELQGQGLDFEIKGRPKSIFSIWNKMKKQGVSFDEVYDKFAIRIILISKPKNEKADCWRAYSVVTDNYQPNPKRLRDWISIPKSNGYESLHTTVLGPQGKWVEVQIRSQRMNEIAEKGLAAHWKYKGIKGDQGIDDWFKRIREFLETPEQNAIEFLDTFKLNLYQKEVFVFTPTGDLKRLPAGATVLDFAFDIHTDVGSQCTGAKIDHKIVSIKQTLSNGDHVAVMTSKNQKPKPDWLNYVVTSKAKAKIKQTIKEEENKLAQVGKELVARRFKNWKLTFNDELLKEFIKYYKTNSANEFYSRIAEEKIDVQDLKEYILNKEKKHKQELAEKLEKERVKNQLEIQEDEQAQEDHSDLLIIDKMIRDVDYKLAKCCKPILGDDIFGFVTVSEGIKIHRTNCPNAKQLISKYDYRIVEAKWSEKSKSSSFQTTIRIIGYDEMGMMNSISEIISKDLKVNMRSVNITSNDGVFSGDIQLFIANKTHLDVLIRRLGTIKGVQKVYRIEQ